jgi:hypothetical protein
VAPEDPKFVSEPLRCGRHLLELNAANVLVRSYVWGVEVLESTQGAGGVGGLLWVILHAAFWPAAGTYFCAYL